MLCGSFFLLALAASTATVVAITACSSKTSTSPGSFGGSAGAGPGFGGSTSPPPTFDSTCNDTLDGFCGANACPCDWAAAADAASWTDCADVATMACAGFLQIHIGSYVYFYDALTQRLVAVAYFNASSGGCAGGPSGGFGDPLVVRCTPPTTTICPGSDAGTDAPSVDAAHDATDAAANDSGGEAG